MLRRDGEVHGQRLGLFPAGDIQEHAAAADGRDRVHRKAIHAGGVRLHRGRYRAVVQVAAAREVAQGVDVRAHVAAESHRLGCGTDAVASDVIAVFLHQAEHVGGVHGMVWHPDEIGLGEVVGPGARELFDEVSHSENEAI